MHIDTTDPLIAHSRLGANGWQLGTLPAAHPRSAIGLYTRQDLTMYLLQRDDHFSLESAPTSTMDSRLPQPREYQTLAEADVLQALAAERNTCTDERVEQIEREMLDILIKYWS